MRQIDHFIDVGNDEAAIETSGIVGA